MEIVQDTNVFVAALRSAEGASAEVLDRCLARADQAVMGAALFAEYEELIHRESLWRRVPVTAEEREALLDDFCAAALWQPIYFRWRPNLPDAGMIMFWSLRSPAAWNTWSRTTFGTSDEANSSSLRPRW